MCANDKNILNSFIGSYTKLEKTLRDKGLTMDELERYYGDNKYNLKVYKLELLRRIRNFMFHNDEWKDVIALKSGSIGFLNKIIEEVKTIQ